MLRDSADVHAVLLVRRCSVTLRNCMPAIILLAMGKQLTFAARIRLPLAVPQRVIRWRITFAQVFCFCLSVTMAFAQELDGPKHIFHDPLLENMVGTWKLNGRIAGREANHTVDADWVLNHQFLRIHEKDNGASKDGAVPYEAIVMIGYDNASEHYMAHWTDIYGGRFSETLGYGTRSGNEIRFTFEYPDGPFHTTFRWKPDSSQWQWLMEGKNKQGQWTEFANVSLIRTTAGVSPK